MIKNKKKRINLLFIIGTRPQYIKISPLLRAINNNYYKNYFSYKIIDTGQHYDTNMSKIFYKELSITKPHINLNVKSHQSNIQTSKILTNLENKVNFKKKFDYIIVFGDTNSTLAGSLFSIKNSIKLIHIESGLRSYEKFMHEEINRVITDRISTILFCPTKKSILNLKKEGITKNVIYVGDLMYDNFIYFKKKLTNSKLNKENFILATLHRSQNTDNIKNLKKFIIILRKISKSNTVIFPIHPRTKKMILKNNININGIKILSPQSYISIIKLLIQSKILITDSGGLQKEAYFAKIPCVTLREKTEWDETLINGWNRLAKIYNTEDMIKKIDQAINFDVKKQKNNFFGNSKAANKILDYLINTL